MADKETQSRRIEKFEDRLRETEQGLATLTSNIQLINDNLKEDIERTRTDLRERLADLKADIKGDFDQVDTTLHDLNATVNSLNDSLQNLYITQSGSNVKVKFNEKIIWTVLGLIGTAGLYLIQDLIKAAAGTG